MCLPEKEETVAFVLARVRAITSSHHLFETGQLLFFPLALVLALVLRAGPGALAA